jgi:hypothetical protein
MPKSYEARPERAFLRLAPMPWLVESHLVADQR